MSMSKKDYEAIARVIRVNRRYAVASPEAKTVIDDVARDLSVTFGSANERFDREKFLAACEVE